MTTKDCVLNSMSDYICEKKWAGACYASTAILYLILNKIGIESNPCIGVVECENGEIFDHSWTEIERKVYDLALPFPLGESTIHTYFENRFGFRGVNETRGFSYGLDRNLDEEASAIADKFSNIMNERPFFDPTINYWDISVSVAKKAGISLNREEIEKEFHSVKFLIKRSSNQ